MTRIVAIRPEPGLSATLAKGRAEGLDITGWPLFEIRPRAWEPPSPDGIDGVLVGSANALRHAGPALSAFLGKPAYAVGAATAEAAREAGFAVRAEGKGGLQQLLGTLKGHPLTLLRLAGAKHIPLIPPLGIVLDTRITYESAPLPMPPEMARALGEGALVLLHSAEAAQHFTGEVERLGLDKAKIALAALGPRIVVAAGPGWREVRAVENPREEPLLALARDMCH
jgi:uroporphyrinogen-III synthase